MKGDAVNIEDEGRGNRHIEVQAKGISLGPDEAVCLKLKKRSPVTALDQAVLGHGGPTGIVLYV
jgi:hypothetical protein